MYEKCFVHELKKQNLEVQRQLSLPIIYDDLKLDTALRLDVLVENKIIIEIKAVDVLMPIHQAQLLTYLKLAKLKLGLLINFNVPIIKQGIKRLVFLKGAEGRATFFKNFASLCLCGES